MKTRTILAGIMLLSVGCLAMSPKKMYNRNNDKVVMLHMVGLKTGGICSGAFIDDDGMVLTCAHCFHIKDEKIYVKTSGGDVYRSALVRIDPVRDLALVWTGANDVPFLPLGNNVHTGEVVYAFGSPLGIQNTMSVGWVENSLNDVKKIILHSAAVNPGNSGGPLVDERGQLVGVNEAILMQNPFMEAQSLFVAIDVSEVKAFLGEK